MWAEDLKKSGAFNSTFGRFIIMAVFTLGMFLAACLGVVFMRMPSIAEKGLTAPLALLTILDICVLISGVGYLAEYSGMSSRNRLKPYFCMWRLSFSFMCLGLVFLLSGYGESVKFGGFADNKNILGNLVDIADLSVGFPFAAIDGFVATNLTRSYVKVLLPPTDPYWAGKRVSHIARSNGDPDLTITQNIAFTEWRYFEPENPSVQGHKKKHPPDTIDYMIVVPIFQKFQKCLTRFKAAPTCMDGNPIVGLAIHQQSSMCNSLRMVNCKEDNLTIIPMSGCVSGAQLCGRVVSAPSEHLRDEIMNQFLSDGWTYISSVNTKKGEPVEVRNASTVWVDINEDPYIMNSEMWLETWARRGNIGLGLSLVAILLVLAAIAFDCYTDNKLRLARSYIV